MKDEETEEIVGQYKNGKDKVKKVIRSVGDIEGLSGYAMLFDAEHSREYTGSYTYDLQFILDQEQYANWELETKGRTFICDAHKKLGKVERVDGILKDSYFPEGQLVGWLRNGDGDGFVDFQLYSLDENGRILWDAKDIPEKYYGFAIDFNVDGVIFDKI